MTFVRIVLAALLGAAITGAALIGCTSEEPATAPATSATTTVGPTADATAEPTEITAPEQPTVMASNDAIGARAAAEYFLSLHTYVLQSGDLAEWDTMCHPESVFCQSVRERVQAGVQAGSSYRGGEVTTVVESVLEPSGAVEYFEVAGKLTQAPSETFEANGVVSDERTVAVAAEFSVFLSVDPSGRWIVRAVDLGKRSDRSSNASPVERGRPALRGWCGPRTGTDPRR